MLAKPQKLSYNSSDCNMTCGDWSAAQLSMLVGRQKANMAGQISGLKPSRVCTASDALEIDRIPALDKDRRAP